MWSATVEHHVHVVLDQQDREAGIEPHQEPRHLGDSPDDEPRGRLVEQQDLGIAGETKHDLELALLAVRQVAHLGVLAIRVKRPAPAVCGPFRTRRDRRTGSATSRTWTAAGP